MWFIHGMCVMCVDNVLRTVLALFMEDEDLPLPTLEEILICNQTTTAEEVYKSYLKQGVHMNIQYSMYIQR